MFLMGFRKYHDTVCFTLAFFFSFSFSLGAVPYRCAGQSGMVNQASAEAVSGSVGGVQRVLEELGK